MPKPNPKLASIRTRNPGAQWPNEQAKLFGMTGFENLKDGNKIAIFPTPVQGAAANMALLDRSYVGMTISSGQLKWSGQHRSGLPGWKGTTVITKKMCADPTFVVPFMKSIADFEAPNGSYVMTDAEWRQAFDLFRTTIYGDATEEMSAKRKPENQEDMDPVISSSAKSKTIWGGILGYVTGVVGWFTAMFDNIDNKFALIAFIVAVILGAIALWMVITGRIRIAKIARQLGASIDGQETKE